MLPQLQLRHALMVLKMSRLYHRHVNKVEAVLAQLSVPLSNKSVLASAAPRVSRLTEAIE